MESVHVLYERLVQTTGVWTVYVISDAQDFQYLRDKQENNKTETKRPRLTRWRVVPNSQRMSVIVGTTTSARNLRPR